MESIMWVRGDRAVLRYRKAGRLSLVTPTTVVNDAPDRVSLFVAPGTPLRQPVHLDSSPIPRSITYEERWRTPWRLGEGIWRDTSVLWTWQPGANHSVGMFWNAADHRFLGWYVNLQASPIRTPIGFDTEDHVLDIQVAPDRTWAWKDEDEYAVALRIGRFTAEEGSRIRAAGLVAVDELERRAWPFDTDWADWHPDPGWSLPTLPDAWDQHLT
jgi:hypothetical protein